MLLLETHRIGRRKTMCILDGSNNELAKAIIETKREVEGLKIQMAILQTNMKLLIGICSSLGIATAGVMVKLLFNV